MKNEFKLGKNKKSNLPHVDKLNHLRVLTSSNNCPGITRGDT